MSTCVQDDSDFNNQEQSVWATPAGQLAQLEPQVEKLQQHCEALRAELQSSKHDNNSLSQQVADMDAAAAMHLAHQVCQQELQLPVSQL